MPIYDYRCHNCGNEFEGMSTIAQRDNPRICHKCGSWALKVITTPPKVDWLNMAYTGESPEFADHLARRCKQQKEKEEKSIRDHGDYGPAPGA